MRWNALLLLLITSRALFAQDKFGQDKIGFIEFLGSKGLDVQAVRQALPFHEGDVLRPEMAEAAQSAVLRVTGMHATDVEVICCTSTGARAIFIGLPGASSHPVPFDPAPQSVLSPPAELTRLAEELQKAERDAGTLQEVDNSAGYRLLDEPRAQAAERALHHYAEAHEEEILQVLAESGDGAQRAMAADALGFGARTPRQLAALVRAARDPEVEVRNNGTRALFEILRADKSTAAQIAPDPFISMLGSGTWTDRNKGSMVLLMLTESRDPVLLRRIQAEAGDALREMAAWRPLPWAMPARILEARVEGNSDLTGIRQGLPLSLWQGALLAAVASGLVAFVFVRLASKGASWSLALLTPALISALLYWAAMRFVGFSISGLGLLAFLFLLPWYLAGVAASCAAAALKWGVSFSRR